MLEIQRKLLIPPYKHSSIKFIKSFITIQNSKQSPTTSISPVTSLNSSFQPQKSSQTSFNQKQNRRFSLTKIPKISASSWTIVKKFSGETLQSYNPTQVREIASLTKIMTCITVLNLLNKLQLNWDETQIQVPSKVSQITGNTANLKPGDQVSLKSLLYGLMLPSGNDAAWVLAEFLGKKLNPASSKPVHNFISKMNKIAKSLNMTQTSYKNPHGLIKKTNLSCAQDVAKLAVYAMKNERFRSIVKCKSFKAEIMGLDGTTRVEVWDNKNELLKSGFSGVKTGITWNAGPCLCACYEGDVEVLIVLLNSDSVEARWREAKELVRLVKAC